MLPRVGYLGPEGTFSEEALLSSARPNSVTPVGLATIYDTVMAVRGGAVQWGVVPIENSLDGSVTVTLDLLAEGGMLAETGMLAKGERPPVSVERASPESVEGKCLPASIDEHGACGSWAMCCSRDIR
jgi:hypothetical protein